MDFIFESPVRRWSIIYISIDLVIIEEITFSQITIVNFLCANYFQTSIQKHKY